LVLFVGLLVSSPAFAQIATTAEPSSPAEPPTPAAPEPAPPPIGAADVADAPKPGDESGRLDRDPGDGAGRSIARGLLWIPRLPFEAVAQPIRGTLYLKERYHAFDVISSWFTTEDKKVAIFPTALVETGFGWNVGMRVAENDAFGGGERIKLRVGIGGQWRSIAEARIDLGEHDKRTVSGGIRARLEERDQERFYGYGNAPTSSQPPMLIDPTTDGTAVGTLFLQKTGRITPYLTVRLPQHFEVTGRAAFTRDRVATGSTDPDDDADLDDRPIGSVYDTTKLPGFGRTDSVYSELELGWDTRRTADEYDAPGIRGTGGLVAVFGGRYETFDRELGFWRGGIDLQRYIPLTRGPRVIELRGYAETVSGPRDEIPFLELPRLGGSRMLRGYDRDRYRDRVSAVAQAAYLFSMSRYLAASLFVDVGRVYSGLDALTYKDQHVGFGGALEVYNDKSMVIRAEVAASIDGGVYAYISLDPAFDARARTEKR
jgi:hypothetical protein